LRGTACPLNWVKTKLQLEEMSAGAVLEVLVDDGSPARNVPRSVCMEGHLLLETSVVSDGVRLLIEKR